MIHTLRFPRKRKPSRLIFVLRRTSNPIEHELTQITQKNSKQIKNAGLCYVDFPRNRCPMLYLSGGNNRKIYISVVPSLWKMTPENGEYGSKPVDEYASRERRLELIGQVMDKYHTARLAGERPAIDEYVKRYAHLQPELGEFLRDEEWMYNTLGSITSKPLPDGFLESVKEKLDARIAAYEESVENA